MLKTDHRCLGCWGRGTQDPTRPLREPVEDPARPPGAPEPPPRPAWPTGRSRPARHRGTAPELRLDEPVDVAVEHALRGRRPPRPSDGPSPSGTAPARRSGSASRSRPPCARRGSRSISSSRRCRSSSARRAFRIRIATALFCSCDRSFWHAATSPGREVRDPHGRVGGVHRLPAGPARAIDVDPQLVRRRSRCPPRRPPRAAGSTSSDANEVCRRFCASNGLDPHQPVHARARPTAARRRSCRAP